MANNKCNICQEIRGQSPLAQDAKYQEMISTGENVILESKNFLIIPSFGPLDSSHAMLVPKKHVTCIAALPPQIANEGHDLLNELQEKFRKKLNKELIFFESGTGKTSKQSGGCIVHAHIHCLIESEDFHQRIFDEVNLIPVVDRDYSLADKKTGYVWYKDKKGNSYLCNNPLLPSQFLRYIYSQGTDNEAKWNWRRHPNIEGILEVIKSYSNQ